MLCCDWIDIIIAAAGGIVLGCVATGWIAKQVLREQLRQPALHERTEWKDRQCR